MEFSRSQKNPAGSRATGLISALINPDMRICVCKRTHITVDGDVIRENANSCSQQREEEEDVWSFRDCETKKTKKG